MLAILTTHPIQYQVPLWQALAKDGRVPFEVWFLTDHGTRFSHDAEFGKEFAWDIDTLSGYPYRFLETANGASPGSFWKCRLKERLRERLHASGARVLWIQGWQVAAYWQAVFEGKRAGLEVWLRGESNNLAPTCFWKKWVKWLLLGQLFRRVDRFLYIGAANRRLYETYGVPQSRLYPTPYAVDNDRFAQQAEVLQSKRSELRRQWGIPNGTFCVLFCGKFIPKKRPTDLIEAARLLVSDGRLPNLHLLFAGSGELGASIRSQCRVLWDAEKEVSGGSRPLQGPFRPTASFAGFLNQTEISKAYVAADCLALPSDFGETWGLVVNEAMASGLPCVVSRACGCAEDLPAQLNPRFCFDLSDIQGFANALAAVACSPSSTIELTSCLERNTIQATVATIERLYSRLA